MTLMTLFGSGAVLLLVLCYVEQGDASIAIGRSSARPFFEEYKRNLALGRVGPRPGKRNVASGRWNLRPGKRSIATGRMHLRPGKRAFDSCNTGNLDELAERMSELLSEVDVMAEQIKACTPPGFFDELTFGTPLRK